MIKITKENLEKLLQKHFPGQSHNNFICENFEFGKSADKEDWFIRYGDMYSAPQYSTERFILFCKDLGTLKVNVGQYNYTGCETCDFGSDYGIILTIPVSELDII